MSKVIQLNFKRKRPASLLGLALDGNQLEGVVLRRSNGTLQIIRRFTAPLSLDWLTNEVELAGRELLNHLEAAGVRERHCVMAVPLKWTLAAHTTLPKLSEADVPGFLQIEAERGFPTDLATLQVATSRLVSSTEQHATFVGVPQSHLERLELVLRAARLKPVAFSLGITALQPTNLAEAEGVLALALGENQVGLLITCGGGVAALRALEGVMETEGGQRLLRGELIIREARITLGQLPADLRDKVKHIRIFGPRERAQKLADDIRSRFEPGGLRVDWVALYPANEFSKTIPADTAVSPAFSLTARQLIGRNDPFEFLPPKVSAWERMTAKYTSGKLRAAGAAAAALLMITFGLFGVQQWQLMRLRSRWAELAPRTSELTAVQEQIQKFRPWYDDSFRYLSLMKKLAVAFPEDGSVTAKTLEIRELVESRDPSAARNMSVVTCSGTAANYTAWIKTVHQIGAVSGVSDLSQQTRGKSPIQFTLDFHWNGGGDEN